tara:strand:- start:658 stop:1095 length:438 start_codon:yes stop_codon:yes gene_type:complete
MRLTAFTDIGLRTLMYLSSLPAGQLSSVSEISQVYNISKNHTVKIVGQLSKYGYITTIRGRNGGICLALPQEQINIGEVIRHLENHLDGVDCITSSCQLVGVCELKKALAKAMEAFLKTMDNYTLADLVINKQQLNQFWITSQAL